jgi:hypothetical protein
MSAAETYRGWEIHFEYPPIPVRDFDWQASHKDYDGAPDANDNRLVHGSTLEAVKAEIDAWIEEHSEDQR